MHLRLQFIIYSTGMKDRMVNLDFAILIHSPQQQDSPVTTRGQEIPVDGFTLDTSIAGTVTDGTTNIQNVLSLKLYYTRNTHQVSYQYEGDVPTGAPAVPDVANHKYQAQVTVAENPNVTGYIFIGWTAATENGTAVTTTGGKFVMPDANVELKVLYSNRADL